MKPPVVITYGSGTKGSTTKDNANYYSKGSSSGTKKSNANYY